MEVAFGGNRDLRKAYEQLFAGEIERADAALLAGRGFDATVTRTRTVVVAVFAVAVALAGLIALLMARFIVRPLRQVSAVLDAVGAGDLSQHVAVEQQDEVGQMARSLRRASETLRRTVMDLTTHSTALDGAAGDLTRTSRDSAASAAAGSQ